MKKLFGLITLAAALSVTTGCDAFKAANNANLSTSQGSPYELIVVCNQDMWAGELGDSLRSILLSPVPFLNQTEPLFDVLRVTERGVNDLISKHRNILRIKISPDIEKPVAAVRYDVAATPQIVITMQGPTVRSVIDYLSRNRADLIYAIEKAERDRAVSFAKRFTADKLNKAIKEKFGVDMTVPQGYTLRSEKGDFIWASYEYPTASQGFFIYSYPYTGPDALSAEALLTARTKYATEIPGPADGSHMITSEVFMPDYKTFSLDGRTWAELRGFWDVEGDFMGGPFVSFSTVDVQRNTVFTIDCYVYSPKVHKRNFIRGLEHMLYMISFPAVDTDKETSVQVSSIDKTGDNRVEKRASAHE